MTTLAGLLALGTTTAAFAVDHSQPTLNRAGDARADRGVTFVDENGDINWEWDISSGGQVLDTWGNIDEGDIPIIGDFDGDGRNDPTVYRPGTPSRWFILGTASAPRIVTFGDDANGDVPLHGDFDGDRRADVAVARPGAGGVGPWTWFIAGSTGRSTTTQWGETETDTAVPANYVGDGRSDIAVRRFEDDGTTAWYIRNDNGSATRIAWGDFDDTAITGDYDGDGYTDVAVIREVGEVGADVYRWFIRFSSGRSAVVDWGDSATDLPVWHDQDGDGRTDIGVWREDLEGETASFIMRSSRDASAMVDEFGFPGDLPAQIDYLDLINGAYDPAAPVSAASGQAEEAKKNVRTATERVARG